MNDQAAKSIPQATRVSRPYWEACQRDELLLQICRNCQRHIFYPRLRCPFCGSPRIEHVAASGRGHVYSYSVVHAAPNSAYAAGGPYVVVLVELDEGPRMMANLVGPGALDAQVGDQVTATFEVRAGGFKVPQFVRSK